MNINLTLPTRHQVAVVGSHLVVGALAAIAALSFFGGLDADQVKQATQDVNHIAADFRDLYASGASLAALAMIAYSAIKSGPFASFIRSAADIASSPKLTAQVQAATLDQKANVVAITNTLPEVSGVATVNTRAGQALATAVPSSTVQVAKLAAILLALCVAGMMIGAPPAQAQGRKASIATPITNALNALSAIIEKDGDGALKLSNQIPELQDYVGQACWTQIGLIGKVVAAHKIPATLQLATDFEAVRLVGMALNKVCANTNCNQIWTDVQNVVTAINPGVIPVSLPSICAKVPVLGMLAASALPPVATPTPTPTPTPVAATPAAPTPADTPASK